MTQHNTLYVKLSNSQLNKLKSAIKNKMEVVLTLSPNMIGEYNDKAHFPHELLLTDRQISSICKAFSSNLSADVKFKEFKESTIKNDTIRRIFR